MTLKIKREIRQRFNRASITYDQGNELQVNVGNELLTQVLQRNKSNKNFDHVLDLGCGTGSVTQQFAKVIQPNFLMGIDMAESLLPKAASKLSKNSFAHLCAGDFDHIPVFPSIFNLVFANMSLQWSLNFEKTIQEIHRILQVGGLLAFSMPLEGSFIALKKVLFQLTGESYLNHFLSSNEIQHVLNQYGFYKLQTQLMAYQFNFTNLKEALYSIKKVGATYPRYSAKPLSKSVFQRCSEKNIQLDYTIGFFVCYKDNIQV